MRISGEGALPADLCAWTPTPRLLWPWVKQEGGCRLRDELGAKATGLARAREWVVRAKNLAALYTIFFRGVELAQVCVVCEGHGYDVSMDPNLPSWIRACKSCEGKGFHGERDWGRVRAYQVKPLDPPAKFLKRLAEAQADVQAEARA